MSRIPLWLTLVPLVLGVLIWGWLWNGYRQDFIAELKPWLPADAGIESGGFPYRLQATIAPLAVQHSGPALQASLNARQAVINQVPWQARHRLMVLENPQLRLDLSPLRDASVSVRAPAAQASLRTAEQRVERLSVVWKQPEITAGWLAAPVRAATLETHLRETPARGDGGTSPRLPTQDQLVIAATGLHFGQSDALALNADMEITAAGPVRSLAGWLAGGTLEIRSLVLTDAHGEVARFTGTLVPDGAGGLRIAGTVDTICPASLRAAAAGEPHPTEHRARRLIRIAFTGLLPGGLELEPADPAKPAPPVRAQEPVCPRFA